MCPSFCLVPPPEGNSPRLCVTATATGSSLTLSFGSSPTSACSSKPVTPDGRIGKALEGFLGFDPNAEVREVLATGDVIEAEVYLGEAKLYVEVHRDDDGNDWIVKTEIDDVASSLAQDDRRALTKTLRKHLESKHLRLLAAERAEEGWQVVFDVEGRSMATLLTDQGIEPLKLEDATFRPLVSQLVTSRALEIARMIGLQAELEVFALRKNRQPAQLIFIEDTASASVAFDPKRELQWVAEDVFAETSLAVTVDKMTGRVRVETLEPTFD